MIVGVTGGTGAGKSTVCALYESLGAVIVDADRVGHETLEDPAVRSELVDAFGEAILDGEGGISGGCISRRELGRRAFATEEGRATLNLIVWPPLGRLLQEKVAALEREDPERPVVIDAALIVEWGDPKSLCDVLVLVTADRETRKHRTMDRLGVGEEQAEARMAAQLPDDAKERVAHHVIRNDGSMADLVRRARNVWDAITS